MRNFIKNKTTSRLKEQNDKQTRRQKTYITLIVTSHFVNSDDITIVIVK